MTRMLSKIYVESQQVHRIINVLEDADLPKVNITCHTAATCTAPDMYDTFDNTVILELLEPSLERTGSTTSWKDLVRAYANYLSDNLGYCVIRITHHRVETEYL